VGGRRRHQKQQRHCERSEAIQSNACDSWTASSLRSSQ
jgi:hypothetical protein